jgi:hypothetical protein
MGRFRTSGATRGRIAEVKMLSLQGCNEERVQTILVS